MEVQFKQKIIKHWILIIRAGTFKKRTATKFKVLATGRILLVVIYNPPPGTGRGFPLCFVEGPLLSNFTTITHKGDS